MQLSPAYREIAAAVEKRLEQALAFDAAAPHAPVLDAMAYATLGGGKRLRGVLAVLSADLCGVDRERSLTLAAGIECLHAYSLAHDDLPAMDNSDLRRGKPSVHKAFDEATSVLAGDGLQALAFELAADAGLAPEGMKAFAVAVGRHGMVGGQMQDMLAEAGKIAPSLPALKALHAGKTGALIQFSALAGPYLAGDTTHFEALETYGAAVGLAFQIWDDVLDVEGDAAETGKPTGHDVDKMTFVALSGLEAAKAEAQSLADQACAKVPNSERLQEVARFAVQRKS